MDMAKRFVLRDFRVKYRFFTPADGGREHPVLQGYRSDWVYADDYTEWEISNKKDLLQVYMIWPWAVDEYGLEYSHHELIPSEGFADMSIFSDKMRLVHRKKIRVGVKGYFVEGSRRVAEAEVIDVLYLNHDFEGD